MITLLTLLACTSNTSTETGSVDSSPGDSGTAPLALAGRLVPANPDTTDDLLAFGVRSDGQTDSFEFTWALDGVLREDLTGDTVPATETERGQTWSVTIRSDELSVTDQVDIGNAPPTAPLVSIDPEAPVEHTSMVCQIEAPATDPDGDELSYTLSWLKNGEAAEGDAAESLPGDTVSALVGDDEWTCRVTASDGQDEGRPGEASATVTLRSADWPDNYTDITGQGWGFAGETNTGSGFNTGEWAGWRLASVGDADGDDLADFIVTGRFNDTGADDAGKVYLVRASQLGEPGEYSLADVPTAFYGEGENDHTGRDVAGPGDMDGDGLGDVAFSAYASDLWPEGGRVYLFFSSSIDWDEIVPAMGADLIVNGEAEFDHLGRSLDAAGDVDGDGIPDLIIGSPGWTFDTGQAGLLLGKTAREGGVIGMSQVDLRMQGGPEFENAGIAVSGAGDTDGDGLDDLLVGAWLNADGGHNAGMTYLVLGGSVGDVSLMSLADADRRIMGDEESESSGRAVEEAGDIDGDGLGDVMIGAHGPLGDETADGKVYLFYASTLADMETGVVSDADIELLSVGEQDYAGDALGLAGDVDGDDQPDLIFGSHFNADGGEDCGESYLFLHSSLPTSGVVNLGDADRVWVGEAPFARSGGTVASAGDTDGDGLDDLLIGSYAFDDDRGKAYLLQGPF